MGLRVPDIIKKSNLVEQAELARSMEGAKRENMPLVYWMLKNKIVAEDAITKLLSEAMGGMEILDPLELDIEAAVIRCVPREMAIQFRFIPINRLANNLIIAVGDPTHSEAFEFIAAQLGVKLRTKLASELAIQRSLEKYYGNASTRPVGQTPSNVNPAPRQQTPHAQQRTVTPVRFGGENYVPLYIDQLMRIAVERKASDIHIEPYETELRVRLRIDGSLLEYEDKPKYEAKDALLSRVKIIAGLDISEKRLPQDGNAKLEISGYGKMDFRVSSLPTVYGEKIVLRILDKGNLQLDMTKLGFDTEQLDQFQSAIMRPFGMIVVTGPTGSGKTTTLYSALNALNQVTDCVVTAEDPVEFTIPGINQVHVRPDIDFTFARALKAFLRQDPDVIMLGEIRDSETAEIAMKAALTGHIVLSTLHTNNAPETLERFRNMGVASFTIVSALNAVVAQRLVRKICVQCKTEDDISPEKQISYGLPEKFAGTFKIYKGTGCNRCNNTGYKGRVAIYEVLTMNDLVKSVVAEGGSVLEIKKACIKSGMQTLRQSAWKKVFKGETSISEMLDASTADNDPPKATIRSAS